ncbi:SHOCT domain-containing protein [Streptomyces sp. NPDC012765]|uniref:SHOCT domain-containing protein n=1 Tax=Streptomyces sp. NPDC012765 TaxID=3155249 RepID=UPI0033D49526
MFIRPMGVTVHPANRPAGHPLLRGLLARATGTAEHMTGPEQDTAGAVVPDRPLPGMPPRTAERPEAAGSAEPGGPERAAAIPAGTGPAAEPATSACLVGELTQLAALAREGLLTPQEFTAAKARLLRG